MKSKPDRGQSDQVNGLGLRQSKFVVVPGHDGLHLRVRARDIEQRIEIGAARACGDSRVMQEQERYGVAVRERGVEPSQLRRADRAANFLRLRLGIENDEAERRLVDNGADPVGGRPRPTAGYPQHSLAAIVIADAENKRHYGAKRSYGKLKERVFGGAALPAGDIAVDERPRRLHGEHFRNHTLELRQRILLAKLRFRISGYVCVGEPRPANGISGGAQIQRKAKPGLRLCDPSRLAGRENHGATRMS